MTWLLAAKLVGTCVAWCGAAAFVGVAGWMASEPDSRPLALQMFAVGLFVIAAAGVFSLSLWGA